MRRCRPGRMSHVSVFVQFPTDPSSGRRNLCRGVVRHDHEPTVGVSRGLMNVVGRAGLRTVILGARCRQIWSNVFGRFGVIARLIGDGDVGTLAAKRIGPAD